MNLVNVYKAAGKLEAEMIKAFLEAQDIPVTLSQESVGRTIGLSAGRLGQVQVMVPNSRVEEAKQVLMGLYEGKYELDDAFLDDLSPEDSEDQGT